jgi:hypothetical protein
MPHAIERSGDMDDEILGTARELGHVETGRCEMCGQIIREDLLGSEMLERSSSEVETIKVCPSCRQAIERDELPVDASAGAVVIDSDI